MKKALFLLAVLFLFFFWLGKIPIWSGDEGRFGEIAREMHESGDLIVPHFNYMEHLEKPILAPLLTALSYVIFGVNSFATRFPSAVAAILGIFLTYYFTRRHFNEKTAGLAAVVLMTSAGYVFLGRSAMIDMLMTFFLSATLFCLMTACIEQKPKYYYAAYFFIGLAFITKGLIGIALPALTFLMFLAWTGNWSEIKRMHLGWGILIIGLIFVPWGVVISMREPEFSYVFIMENHFVRYATGSFGRKRPFWFFAPILLAFTYPWSMFIPASLANAIKGKTPEEGKKIKFLISWTVVVFIFFSIPRSKLPYYILPLTMPIAILAATFFHDLLYTEKRERLKRFFKTTWTLVLWISVACILGLDVFLMFFTKDSRALLFRPAIYFISSVLFIGGLCTSYYVKKDKLTHAFLALAGMAYMFLVFAIFGMWKFTPYISTYYFAEALETRLEKTDTVAIYSSPDHFSDLMFHLKRRVVVAGTDRGTLTREVEDPDDVSEAKEWFPDANQFVRLFNLRTKRVFCLVEEEKFSELQNVGLNDFTLIMKDRGRMLISNETSKI